MCLTCREAWRARPSPVRSRRLAWQGAAVAISSPSTAPPACAPFGGRAVGRLRTGAAPCQARLPAFGPGPTRHTSVAFCHGKEPLALTETGRKGGSPNRRIAGERGSFFPSRWPALARPNWYYRRSALKYILRPPLANDRLSILDGGNVRLDFKRPWSNGTSSIARPSPAEAPERPPARPPPAREREAREAEDWVN